MSQLIPLLPLLVVGLGGFILMLVDAFSDDTSELATLSSVILFAGGAIAAVLATGKAGVYAPLPAVAPFLATSGMAQFFNATICFGGGLSALLAGGYLREHALDRGEMYPLIVLSAFGAMVLAAATDLLSIFIGLETMSLGVYAMVAFRRGSPRAAEGGMKYFLLGSFAAAIFLFGAALLYGATGHTDLDGIGKAIAAPLPGMMLRVAVLGMLLVLIGLAFKISAAPFHMWTPDAYEGAVTPATTFMSVVVKAAAFAVLVRVITACFSDEGSASLVTGWPAMISVLAAITMIYGNLAAATQSSVKR
ncbi:MAG TPA: proton-conducting transporter membrane subunit, partial [Polyangiales bacterium]|nr:proton-conducting transporter membrane subunit [Polyangiales bacterium]